MQIHDLITFDIDPVEIESYLDKLKKQESIVTVAGEFSSGKSTFLNALIGKKKFLPEALKECTPVLIDLVKSASSQMGIVYQDGSTKALEMTEGSIDRYARYTKDYDENIQMITVPVDSKFLPENVHFVDTPGSNTTIKKHENIANYIIRKSDVVLYIVDKAFNESDFTRLEYIQQFTEDIVIVLSHMDEGGEGYKSAATIDRFVQEARTNLKDKLGMESVEILPVGSIQAFTDDTYIEPIRECIDAYIKENSISIMKKRVEQQLTQIFSKKMRELEQQTDVLVLGLETEQEEINDKIESLGKKMNRMEDNKQTRIVRLREMAAEQKELLHRELGLLVDDHKESSLTELVKIDATQHDITKILSKAKEAISHELVNKTEQKIRFLLEISYQEMNDEIKNMLCELNLNSNIELTPPSLDELDFEVDESRVKQLHYAKEKYERDLQEAEAEISAANEQNEELLQLRKTYEEELQKVTKQMWSLGDYQAEFTEKKVDVGGSAGGKFGRFVGEVADIALIFYNPAGAGVAAADTAKDAAKIGSLLNRASQGKKAGEQAKMAKDVIDKAQKAKKIADKAKKGKETFDKIVTKRKEAVENLESYKVEQPEEKQKSVLDLLDYLSLGFWGEKLGQSIGEQVKPTKTVYEENNAKRREWEEAQETIRQSMLDAKMSIESTEREIAAANSITEKRRLKMQLEDKVERQNQLIEENKCQIEREKTVSIQKEVEMYYQEQLEQLFFEELKTIKKEVNAIMDYAINAVEKNYRYEMDREMQKVKGLVSDLQQSEDVLSQNVERNRHFLRELSNYPCWIEDWVNMNGNS